MADKFSSDYQDRKTGELVGGYINERFYKFPDAGTPANPDVPRDGGNPMMLKPGERSRTPRPHQWSVERRMQEAREKGSTEPVTLGKTASTRTAGWNGEFDLESAMDSRLMEYWQGMPEGSAKDMFSDAVEEATEATMETGSNFNRRLVRELNNMAKDPEYASIIGAVAAEVKRIMSAQVTASGWLGRMVEAQVNVENFDQDLHAQGTINKTINGVEIELEWAMSPDPSGNEKVEFEWPENMMMNVQPGTWDGDVCNPSTGELLIPALERENLEDRWTEEVIEEVMVADYGAEYDKINPPDKDMTAASKNGIRIEAKKKGKPVNPWAVCHTTVDKDKNPEKYEDCVQAVKKEHPVKESSDDDTARKVIASADRDSIVKLSSEVVKATDGDDRVVTAFKMAVDLHNEGIDDKDSVLRMAETTGMTIESASRVQSMAIRKMAAHVSDVYQVAQDEEAPAGATDKPRKEVQEAAKDVGLVD
jgi:hypothetical protein